ncbi:conserved hypothetical protein [Roseibium sp. TrichSKD4]|uniref:hypothetical protein n=1 Tax=Roseibium sp. TrichSKD4 TaxID=744980 RepID=UPI0001E56660|nr:conserved hypothetical protein [Roseibium sp. TrichSKD4]
MTLQTTKPTQMRLHSCVLSQPKRDKVHEKLKNRAYVTVKIDNRPDNAAVRVANVRENGQPRRNTQLLGKYPLMDVFLKTDCVLVINELPMFEIGKS